MKLYYNSEKTKELQNRIIEWWEKNQQTRDNKIHVYDIVNCEAKAYLRLTGEKAIYTNQNAGLLVFGIIGAMVIQLTYPEDEREYECDLEKLIFAHLDVFAGKLEPMEIKNTRKKIFSKSKIPEEWINQLMCYMVITKKNVGHLIFMNALATTVTVFTIEMASDELAAYQMFMFEKMERIVSSAAKRDCSILTILPLQHPSCPYKLVCPREKECKQKYAELKKAGKEENV